MRYGLYLAIALIVVVIAAGIYVVHKALYYEGVYKSIKVDGRVRTFLIYEPPHYNKSRRNPLVIALHGGGGDAQKMEKLTNYEFNRLADRYGFMVVYPEAVEKHWNDGRGIEDYTSQRENVDDVKFISRLIDFMVENYSVDPKRVYVTGMSNGAIMSFRIAYELGNKVAAIAPVAGEIPYNVFANETPIAPVSVLMINGLEDPLVPWDGGYVHFRDRKLGRVIGVEKSLEVWVKKDNCTVLKDKHYLPDKADDGTRVWLKEYRNNTTGEEVLLYGIDGGGHAWPGGSQYFPEGVIGKTSRDIDACQVIWSFFSNHTLNA